MKKSACLGVVFSVFFILMMPSFADKPTFAEVTPAGVSWDKWLDHTYVCYKGSKKRCFSHSGRNSGGKELSGTRGQSDTDYVSCVYKEWKDYGICYYRYGIEGVCHQETNTGLGDAGTTVRKAKGYNISSKYFYTYGTNPNVGRCVATCLKR